MNVARLTVFVAVLATTTTVSAASDCSVDGGATIKPMVRPAGGPVLDGFGLRRDPMLGVLKLHEGIDYGGLSGDPVRAVAAGVVTFAARDGAYGLRIGLRHGGDIETRYAHLARLGVAVGDCVAQGSVIGTIGSTGFATRPHLHFELADKTGPIDPVPFMPPG